MVLIIDGHHFQYEMENLCRVFFPDEQINVLTGSCGNEKNSLIITTSLLKQGVQEKIRVSIKEPLGKLRFRETELNLPSDSDDVELSMAVELFHLLFEYTGYRPLWGVLTGVRPSKLMNTLLASYGEQKALEYFENKLLVSKEKTDLALRVANAQRDIISMSDPMSFSLYVSIPFCPTRCSYCSFVSHSITSDKAKKLLPQYLNLLCKEIACTAKIANHIGLKLETVYVGGGTPSILDNDQIKKLLYVIGKEFNLDNIREFTFEAGRPDTINAEKLRTIKGHKVSRISINPQTFSDDLLRAIGREHTSQQIIDAYKLAKNIGFANINMDIIAGMPGDNFENFKNTISKTLELAPQGITVHSLALKRSSGILNHQFSFEQQSVLASKMIEHSNKALSKNGYTSYYMYRQNKTVGHLENVGWCKTGFEGYYNIYMMEECHTVLAVGAGAVTKLKSPAGAQIQRIFNLKYPYEYINRFDEIIDRKEKIYEFYSS